MQKHVVHKKIAIQANPEQVWDALTNPEKTKKYFFHCAVYSHWKEGSDIVFKGRIFLIKKIELRGKILKIEPQKLLQYQLKNRGNKNHPPTTSTVTDKLTFTKGITTLSITDDVGTGEGAEKRYARSMKGWDKILNGLKALVEK